MLQAMCHVENNKVLRLTMLLHDIGKPDAKTTDEVGTDHFHGHAKISEDMTKRILRRLKFDNDTLYKVSKLVFYHDYDIEPTAKAVRKAVNKIGEDIFPYLFAVKRADTLAQSRYKQEEKLNRLLELEKIYKGVIEAEECVSLRTLAVTGRDLIDMGMKPGKELGAVLNQLLEIVLDNPEKNTKEELLLMVQRM